jgi:ATP-dependent DNA ligase
MQAGAYGLSVPQMVILVYTKDNPLPLAQFAVGEVAPDGQSRYVLKVGSGFAVTIANYQIENLQALIQSVSRPPSPQTKKDKR